MKLSQDDLNNYLQYMPWHVYVRADGTQVLKEDVIKHIHDMERKLVSLAALIADRIESGKIS